jgi:hypothetical protein
MVHCYPASVLVRLCWCVRMSSWPHEMSMITSGHTDNEP